MEAKPNARAASCQECMLSSWRICRLAQVKGRRKAGLHVLPLSPAARACVWHAGAGDALRRVTKSPEPAAARGEAASPDTGQPRITAFQPSCKERKSLRAVFCHQLKLSTLLSKMWWNTLALSENGADYSHCAKPGQGQRCASIFGPAGESGCRWLAPALPLYTGRPG